MTLAATPHHVGSRIAKLYRIVGVFSPILLGLVLIAIIAPPIAPNDPNSQNLIGRLKAPGTDARGYRCRWCCREWSARPLAWRRDICAAGPRR